MHGENSIGIRLTPIFQLLMQEVNERFVFKRNILNSLFTSGSVALLYLPVVFMHVVVYR
jgi:hypothetical protein